MPIRHLEAIESGDYREMPTPTYAVGFAKAYARSVGEDEAWIGRDVRTRTAAISAERQDYKPYELDDPARVPPRGLALIAGGLAVIVLLAALAWFGTTWFAGGSAPQTAQSDAAAPVGTATPTRPPLVSQPIPAAQAPVVLTALDRVWVRVADGTGKTLFQATMNPNDTYQVPTDANGPKLTVGRPDQLRVTVDGKALPALGSGARPMKDVPIDATSLSQRAAASAATTSASPAVTSTTTPRATPSPVASPSPRPTKKATSASPPKPDNTPAPKPSPSASQTLPPPSGIY